MRYIVIAVLFAACSTTPAPNEQAFLALHKSCLVETETSSGSGFAINETQVMTAWHVVQYATSVKADGRTACHWSQLELHDAAIITFERPHGLRVWTLRSHDVTAAERVYISGWGVGRHWWSSGYATEDPDRINLPICPGDSGAPVYDKRGAVVGIVTARGHYAQHHCHIVPMSRLLPAIQGPPRHIHILSIDQDPASFPGIEGDDVQVTLELDPLLRE